MITDADHSRFINQLYAIPRHEIRFLLGMNLNILSSISLLHRSKLFLSGLNSCTPTSLDPDSKKIISTAITQALQSAHRIACLISFLLEMISDPTQKTYFGSTLFEWNTFLTNPIFEAIIVFWFIQCRMNPEWWGFVERGNCPRDVVRQRILDMISVLENAASYQKELLAPHVVCVKAMLE
ncbi:hypothetical protein BDR26DRAFT_349292 [Obelidium mucronatum]|nr:hypothetical protein BDR26DRAFT_349292 [Obelidium mucronatum]